MITPDDPLKQTISSLPFASLVDFIRNESASAEVRKYAARTLREAYRHSPLLAAKLSHDPEFGGIVDNLLREEEIRATQGQDAKG